MVPGEVIFSSGRNRASSAATEGVSPRRDATPHRQQEGDLLQHDRRIFDEHRIGQVRLRGQGNDAGAEPGEAFFVAAALLDGLRVVHRLALEMREDAPVDARADGARESDPHEEIPLLYHNYPVMSPKM